MAFSTYNDGCILATLGWGLLEIMSAMTDRTYRDEYNEPPTFAELDWLEQQGEGRKTTRCNMCQRMVDPGDIRISYFWAGARRYEIKQCPYCQRQWDNRCNGDYERCAVCGDECCSLGDDSLEMTSFIRPHNTREQIASGCICAECAIAWEIWE